MRACFLLMLACGICFLLTLSHWHPVTLAPHGTPSAFLLFVARLLALAGLQRLFSFDPATPLHLQIALRTT
jgi:hypothetical protein